MAARTPETIQAHISSTPTAPTDGDTTEMQGARLNGVVPLSCHVSDGVIHLREAAAPRLLTSTNHVALRLRVIDQPPRRTHLQPTLKVLINKPPAMFAVTSGRSLGLVQRLHGSLTASMHGSHTAAPVSPCPVEVQ